MHLSKRAASSWSSSHHSLLRWFAQRWSMPCDPKHAPRITKTLRPKSAPPDGVCSIVALDAKNESSSASTSLSGKKRPKSSPDVVQEPVTTPASSAPMLHKPVIVRRSLDAPEQGCQMFQIVSGSRPNFIHSSSPKPNKMQIVVEPAAADVLKREFAADSEVEPLNEPVLEEEVDLKEPARKVGFSSVVENQDKEADTDEEAFEDDFDTDEEPVSLNCESSCPEGLGLNKDCWGRLISLTHNQPNVDLTTKEAESFSLGRSSKCNVVVDDPHVSAVQFSLTMYNRAVCEVEIRDNSSNGTYCNAEKLGKGKAMTLSNGDEITFQVCSAEVGTVFAGYIFQFLSPNLQDVRQQQYRRVGKDDNGDAQKGRKPKVKYKVSDVLGRGGFATVYLGMNQDTGELIAVKRIMVSKNEGSKIKAICKEIDILRSLSHSKVVQYLGYEVEAGFLNILLEYVPGGSIASLLEKFGEFDENVIRIYTLQILIGLNYLHDNKVLHRDIKGANILVTQRGTVKLTDFGSARATMGAMPGKEKAELSTMDGGRGLEGTVLWMAPEVISRSHYSTGSDIWALACTVIEMATNKPPWAEKNLTSYVSAMYFIATTKEVPAIPDKLQADARDFLQQCLHLNDGERPKCADLLRHPFITQVGGAEPAMTPDGNATPLLNIPAPPHPNLSSSLHPLNGGLSSRPASQHQHQVFLQQQAELQQSQAVHLSMKLSEHRSLVRKPPPPASANGSRRSSASHPACPTELAPKPRRGCRHKGNGDGGEDRDQCGGETERPSSGVHHTAAPRAAPRNRKKKRSFAMPKPDPH
eukprot:GGOE01006378.1.p1 GENE.GGOE01006378.1~~GGOE01006378.1.p1  ORF type:complete len:809 (-),score=105.90 GGOE01006378.1:276-2702(-)